MSKYSYEFKKKIVMDYINGKGGYKSLCKENGIYLLILQKEYTCLKSRELEE